MKKDVFFVARIKLKEILEKRNLTYRQVEILTGIGKTTLQAIASGERDPRLSTLEQIAAGLNVKITDLFESEYK